MVITLSVMANPFINHLWRTLPPILPERWARLNEGTDQEKSLSRKASTLEHATLKSAVIG
jgi:hypothetical protein